MKHRVQKFRISLLFGMIFLSSAVSDAALNSDAGLYPLSTAGGIVAPSAATSMFQNPAGLVYAQDLNFNTQMGWDSSFNNPIYKGGAYYGTGGTAGIGAGVSTVPSSNLTQAYFGAAVGISSMRTVLGFSGGVGLNAGGTSNFNAGLLLAPVDKVHLGFTGINLGSSVGEWGAGLGLDFGPGARLIVDTAANRSLSAFNVKPGILVFTPQLGVTVSYGMGNAGSMQLLNGFTAGFFVAIATRVNWELHYNQLSTIFTSVGIRL